MLQVKKELQLASRSTSSLLYSHSIILSLVTPPAILTPQAMFWCWSKRWPSREYLTLLKLNVLDLTQISQSLSVYRVSNQNWTRYNLKFQMWIYHHTDTHSKMIPSLVRNRVMLVSTLSGKWLRSCVGADSVGWRVVTGRATYGWLASCRPLLLFLNGCTNIFSFVYFVCWKGLHLVLQLYVMLTFCSFRTCFTPVSNISKNKSNKVNVFG